jgi:hypothetical protein
MAILNGRSRMARSKGREAWTSQPENIGALVTERTLLGVYPGAREVWQLVHRLRPIGLDLRKLSLVFLGAGPPARSLYDWDDPVAELRERLRLHGAMSFESVRAGERVWVAGPLAGLVSPADGASRSLRSVVRAIDEALSRWGARVEELSGLRASMASGRGLVLLHVTAGEVPSALSAMKRSSAEYVTLIGHDHGSFGTAGTGIVRFSGVH